MKNKGFTLVELLIVIAIIGILASMVLPRMFGPTEQSRSTEARNMLGTIRQAEEVFRNGPAGTYLAIDDGDGSANDGVCLDVDNGGAWQRIGIEDPNASSVYFTYCVEATDTTFTIKATRTNMPNGVADAGRSFTLDQTGTWADSSDPAYSQRPRNPNGS